MRFILIDEILSMAPGKDVVASRWVSPESDFFRDHFPGFPVVPGVLLTEMMAQTAGKCLDAADPEQRCSMLARVDRAEFRDWVGPGSHLTISAEIRTCRASFATARARVESEQRLVASAELFFTFVPRAQFAPDYQDEVLERWRARIHQASTIQTRSSCE